MISKARTSTGGFTVENIDVSPENNSLDLKSLTKLIQIQICLTLVIATLWSGVAISIHWCTGFQ